MATVELRLYPPLTSRFTPRRRGVLVLPMDLRPGDTLGHLLDRLSSANAASWSDIYDPVARAVRPIIVVLHNDQGVPAATAASTPLADDDVITLRLVYGGG